jgi:hypothetical protein
VTQPAPDPDRQRHADAIHEAAHAAVGVALGRRVEFVELTPDEARLVGCCKLVAPDQEAWSVRLERGDPDAILDEVTILLAGRLAEIRAGYGDLFGGGAQDAAEAQQLAMSAGTNHLGRLLMEGNVCARRHLFRAEVWDGVLRLAAELVRTGRVEGDDIHRILAGG